MMKIELHEIPIRDIAKGYIDNQEEGVFGYEGKLNIRPKYQREFIYKDKQRNDVIDTIQKNFPLNVMYWVKNGKQYEVLDGQQRTISFCQYIKGKYSINARSWYNLTNDEKEKILNYKCMIYVCEGEEKEQLDWFKIINIAGEKLTDQELRNVVYTGQWLTDAKRHFSKTGCAAHHLANDYVIGVAIRQGILEIALDWISDGKIEEYMSEHQQDENANELWLYFKNVIEWVKVTFPTYHKEMKRVAWGELYNKYGTKKLNVSYLKKKIEKLMMDDDVNNKSGIYPYLLTGAEKYLNIRSFSDSQKLSAYKKQKGICPKCKGKFNIEEMEGDHIKPWSKGGKTIPQNLQMLCKDCNRRKSGK